MANKRYDDFVRAAKAAGLYGQFSEDDLALARSAPEAGLTILSYKQDYADAATDEARALANAGAESVRSRYAAQDTGSGVAEAAAPYAQEQSAVTARLAQPFSYDSETDAAWESYRKQYQREGERAYQNSLGEAAANTGGIASTAAVTAAQQAQNYYGAQAADRKAALYQQAYENWLAGRASDMEASALYEDLTAGAAERGQQSWDNAAEKWKSYGYVTEDVADTLGLPVGTPYTEQAYNEWYQAFQEAGSGVYTGKTQYDEVNEGERAEPEYHDSAANHKSVGLGANSLDVQAMQRYLIGLGYSCGASGADGKFGQNTLAALRAFQRSSGVYADGVCGPVTWTALIAAAGG